MNLRPYGNKVLIKPEPLNRTPAGLFLTEKWNSQSCVGKVVAVGSNVLDVKPGDRISLKPYAGSDLEFGGEKLVLLRIDEITLILPGATDVDASASLTG